VSHLDNDIVLVQASLQFSNTLFLLAMTLFLLTMQSLKCTVLLSQLLALGFLLI
jgi:hypothetical protein